jgi:hypothetical protein
VYVVVGYFHITAYTTSLAASMPLPIPAWLRLTVGVLAEIRNADRRFGRNALDRLSRAGKAVAAAQLVAQALKRHFLYHAVPRRQDSLDPSCPKECLGFVNQIVISADGWPSDGSQNLMLTEHSLGACRQPV